MAYIGTPENDQFVGPQDLQALAEHIYRSEGPSGLNRDYLLNLEKALDELSPQSGDEHITDLSERVRAIIAREEGKSPGEEDEAAVERVISQQSNEAAAARHEFTKINSVDEQEETEKAR